MPEPAGVWHKMSVQLLNINGQLFSLLKGSTKVTLGSTPKLLPVTENTSWPLVSRLKLEIEVMFGGGYVAQ